MNPEFRLSTYKGVFPEPNLINLLMKKHLMTAAIVLAVSTITMAQTPFSVTSTFPTSKATNVDLNANVTFTFDQAIPVHLTTEDLDDYIDVSPRADIQIHDITFSADRRTIGYNVTHKADVDYNWTVTGPHPIDRFHLLSYTTANAFGAASVSGSLNLPENATSSGFAYGYVFLSTDASLSFWEDIPRYSGIATIGENGDFTITGVRPGTYTAYALITSDPSDEENAELYFGTNDSPIPVTDTNVQNVNVQMQSIYNFIPFYHSHAKLHELRNVVTNSFPNAGLKSMVGFQFVMDGSMPDGSSSIWISMWHDPIIDKMASAVSSGNIINVQEVENNGSGALPSLPTDMISSRQAVNVALASGGSSYLSALPSGTLTFVSYSAGFNPMEFGYEQVAPVAPYWFIRFSSSYVLNNEDVDAVFFALVNAQTGEIVDITPTSIEKPVNRDESPASITLNQNYPNPFNPSTVIGFTVGTQNLASVQTRLSVYDLLGREVAVLVDGVMPAGEHRVSFDASGLSSGVYLYRLQSGSMVETRRMTLVK